MRELLQLNIWMIRLAVLIGFALVILIEYFSSIRSRRLPRVIQSAIAGWAAANIIFIVFLWFNHLKFPFTLTVMEDIILQHFQRAVSGQPIYTQPSLAYTALAYNPMFYYLAIPFSWVFGVNLITLRIAAIVGSSRNWSDSVYRNEAENEFILVGFYFGRRFCCCVSSYGCLSRQHAF